MSDSTQRFLRQRDLVPEEAIANAAVTVIGVGAVGRQLALQLAAVGVRQLQLIDFDHVDWPNVSAQGFATSDVGRAKVDAVASAIFDHDPQIGVETIEDRFRPHMPTHEHIFCAVDSIAARDAIWRAVGHRCRCWIDARLLGEVIRILSAADPPSRSYYPTTLFTSEQAITGRCTARSTIYSASIAAGLMVHRFVSWLRGDSEGRDTLFDLATAEVIELHEHH